MLRNLRIAYCLALVSVVPPIAAAPATFTTLYAFNAKVSAGDGVKPTGPLVVGRGGVLYGVTYMGGDQACNSGCGTVYSVTPPKKPGGNWAETLVHSFTGATDDGSEPTFLVIGAGGVLYGLTAAGGQGCGRSGCGTAFSLAPPSAPSGAWTKNTHAFSRHVVLPSSLRLVHGILYGTSIDGGSSSTCQFGCGAFFSLKPPTGTADSWAERLLFSFPYGADGYRPLMAVNGTGGLFYGASQGGDAACPFGCGLVFSLSPPAAEDAGGSWTESVVHTFADATDDGNGAASVTIGAGGVLYGATYSGGTSGLGTVFSLTPPSAPGGAWTEAILHNFSGPPDAANPNLDLVIGKDGTLYGTTYSGGDKKCFSTLGVGCGAVFSLTPPSSPGGAWTETVLHRFTGGRDGGSPAAGLTLGRDGRLYGTTTIGGGSGKIGTVFAVQP